MSSRAYLLPSVVIALMQSEAQRAQLLAEGMHKVKQFQTCAL